MKYYLPKCKWVSTQTVHVYGSQTIQETLSICYCFDLGGIFGQISYIYVRDVSVSHLFTECDEFENASLEGRAINCKVILCMNIHVHL